MAASALDARIGNRITDREVINHLAAVGRESKITVHFVIVERADSGRPESQRFGGKIQAVANGAGFEMHIAVSAISMSSGGAIKVADHGERHACVTGKVLSQAQPRGRDALVAAPDQLQFSALRPVAVDAWLQSVNPMDIQIELDETLAREVGGMSGNARPGRHGKNGR